jgi:hypothetical protein
VRLRRIQRRDAERESLATLDREAGVSDEPRRVAPEMTAARQQRPQRRVRGALESTAGRLRRCDVLEEAQLAARSQHPPQLGQRAHRIGDRAQHEAAHRRIEAAIRERQRLGRRVDDRDVDRNPLSRRGQALPQIWLRLQSDDLVDRGGIVREVRAGAGADLEHAARQALEQPAPSLGEPEPFGPLGLPRVQARAEWVADRDGHAGRRGVPAGGIGQLRRHGGHGNLDPCSATRIPPTRARGKAMKKRDMGRVSQHSL